jgi:hypothetical protein
LFDACLIFCSHTDYIPGGVKFTCLNRAHSVCAHTILQRDDEPMVILDTHQDWRFAKNPLVLGAPHIRFYAGAPLRTQDGFNVGSLTVIDDAPREDFTPRQRHTLKEFAAIAMREMELWRDKIQLRIRDRIQTSVSPLIAACKLSKSQLILIDGTIQQAMPRNRYRRACPNRPYNQHTPDLSSSKSNFRDGKPYELVQFRFLEPNSDTDIDFNTGGWATGQGPTSTARPSAVHKFAVSTRDTTTLLCNGSGLLPCGKTYPTHAGRRRCHCDGCIAL